MEQKQDKKVVSKNAKSGKVERHRRTYKQKNIKVHKKDFDDLLVALTLTKEIKK